MGEIGLLSRSAMAEPRDEMSGFSQELAMGRMVRATMVISGKDPTRATKDAPKGLISMLDQTSVLTKEFSVHYVDCFIERVEPQFLHLSPEGVREDVEEHFKCENNASELASEGARMRKFNTFMTIATGMLLSTDSVSLHGFSSNIHAAATKVFAEILESGTSVNILHCMLSLIIYSMQSSLGGSTWHLLGLAMQKAIAFGFHKDPSHEIGLSTVQIKDRRDIFWGLYTVDRYTIPSPLLELDWLTAAQNNKYYYGSAV
ncbi:uncharacterized protein N7511_006781 [Penicillium nucicola]|uniref:uncharacterized protein n=1 Tax=Penicillium nucicola TaxID=1850975 RepID=UPI0025457FBA|nr:uncharacterized protein N7511_006781 [Penicillium nucicola]KAJ5758087.1 hypothetical protein N7511_006781 [Penicillium nucicola]